MAGYDHDFEWGGKWPGICGRCGGEHKPETAADARCPDPACGAPMTPWSAEGERFCSNDKCPGEVSEYSLEHDTTKRTP